MSRKKILILTHSRDDCAHLVVERLSEMKQDFVRFNTENFHGSVKVVMNLDQNGNFFGRYCFPDFDLLFDDIGIVWNRRVHNPNMGPEFEYEPDLKEWMTDETIWALNISFTMLNCPVVNPWEINERLKFNKIIQMHRAASLGIEIPDSCITNNLAEMRRFWEQVKNEIIFKKIRKGFFQFENGKRLLVHTSKIPPEQLTDQSLHRMRFCPMFFQQHIAKKFDVRSVVVGDQVFSVAIHSQCIPEGVVDYRTAAVFGKLQQMKHEKIDLGLSVNNQLIAFTKSFDLTFSVIDLIITPDDRIVFLEDNPNGQWGWLEHMTGVPISQAFADLLVSLKH